MSKALVYTDTFTQHMGAHTDFHSGKVNLASEFNDTINVPPVIATLRRLCHLYTSHNESRPIVRDKQLQTHSQTHVHPKTIIQGHTHTGENTPTLGRIHLYP